MPSLIFETTARYTLPLLLLFSIFILFRGHNDPGGGFIGGLAAASAFAMYALAYDVEKAQQVLRVPPITLIGVGLLIGVSSGLLGLLTGNPFMTGLWYEEIVLPVAGKPGTPLLFDIGVYLVVVGISLLIIFTLAED